MSDVTVTDPAVIVVEVDGDLSVIDVDLVDDVTVIDIGFVGGPPGPAGPPGSSGPPADWSTAQTVDTVAGATYTVTAGDAGKLKSLSVTATVTLPSAGPTAGQRVDFVCVGGAATFILGAGATWHVAPTPSAVARAAGSMVSAVKVGAATWALTGDLA